MQADKGLDSSWWALRLGFGLVPIVAGLDKFTNLLTNWENYLNPLVTTVLPVSAATFMRAAGVVEVIVGLLILTRFTRLGAYLAAAWLLCIAANLIFMGKYLDVAARDVLLSLSAYTLGRLSEAREGSLAEAPHASDLRHASVHTS